MKSVMTIAGSDSSGGAGIEADIKTIASHRMFATCAITAITAQNTTGVYGVEELTPDFVSEQISIVFKDIRPDAVKIGMVSSTGIIKAISDTLQLYSAENIVVDPVMVATSGSALMESDSVVFLKTFLCPIASVVTPNIPEAEVLSGMDICSEKDMEKAAKRIQEEIAASEQLDIVESGKVGAIMLKGGHGVSEEAQSNDLVLTCEGDVVWLRGDRIDTANSHGTGCTLSSAIACNLADGYGVVEACERAKRYVSGALSAGLNLGKGSGPVDHMWQYR